MSSDPKVYTHVEQIKIQSSYGSDTRYLVTYGYVDGNRITSNGKFFEENLKEPPKAL